MGMKRFALILLAGLIPFVAANAQDSAKEKIEEILKKIERAGGKSKSKSNEATAAKANDQDYVPNVPGPKEPKNSTLAVALLKGTGKAEKIKGQSPGSRADFTFKQKGDKVLLLANVHGLPDGEYGLHIHARDDCSAADFASAGDHFNPARSKHGHPSQEHHAGDMGNLKVVGGKGTTEVSQLTGVSLTVGKTGIIGRSVIIHANPDDFNTQPTGNAGPRIACGVITYDK
jgi:Cu-Zn family superoxide dismutase